jgi:hypothetical protein
MQDRFTLRARDLLLKFGFEDGELFDDWLEHNGFDPLACRPAMHDDALEEEMLGAVLLTEAVKAFLMPKLIGFEISERMSASHNPVRIEPTDATALLALEHALVSVEVTVSAEQIRKLLDRLVPTFPGLASNTTTARLV